LRRQEGLAVTDSDSAVAASPIPRPPPAECLRFVREQRVPIMNQIALTRGHGWSLASLKCLASRASTPCLR
jgi:hypothetical protein